MTFDSAVLVAGAFLAFALALLLVISVLLHRQVRDFERFNKAKWDEQIQINQNLLDTAISDRGSRRLQPSGSGSKARA